MRSPLLTHYSARSASHLPERESRERDRGYKQPPSGGVELLKADGVKHCERVRLLLVELFILPILSLKTDSPLTVSRTITGGWCGAVCIDNNRV